MHGRCPMSCPGRPKSFSRPISRPSTDVDDDAPVAGTPVLFVRVAGEAVLASTGDRDRRRRRGSPAAGGWSDEPGDANVVLNRSVRRRERSSTRDRRCSRAEVRSRRSPRSLYHGAASVRDAVRPVASRVDAVVNPDLHQRERHRRNQLERVEHDQQRLHAERRDERLDARLAAIARPPMMHATDKDQRHDATSPPRARTSTSACGR